MTEPHNNPTLEPIKLMEDVTVELEGLANGIQENDAAEFTKQISPLDNAVSNIRSQMRELQMWLELNMPTVAERVRYDHDVLIKSINITDEQGKVGYDYSNNLNERKAVKENRKVVKQKVEEFARTLRQIVKKAEQPADAISDKARQRSQKKRRKTPPQTIEGEWSKPMTKKEMMSALRIDSYKKFNTFAKQHGLRQAGSRQLWQIRLDTMDKATRNKLEKS